MRSKNNQYLKNWPAGIIEIVNLARIVWKVEDPCPTTLHPFPEGRYSQTQLYCC